MLKCLCRCLIVLGCAVLVPSASLRAQVDSALVLETVEKAPRSSRHPIGGCPSHEAETCWVSKCPCSDASFFDRWRDQCSGIEIKPVYYGEWFTNTRGGLSTNDATRYQALLDLGVEVDLEQLSTLLPGRFFLLAQNTHGRGITKDIVGDAQVLSNIDAGGNITRVNEYWWEFNLLDDSVTVRLGKQDLNTEFFFLETADGFLHSSFGLTPALSLPTFPDPGMSAVVLTQLTDSCELKIGIWDALGFGRGWGISGNDTILAVSELEWDFFLTDDQLPGTFAVGAGYFTDGVIKGEPLDSGYGFLVQFEQLVWRERAANRMNPQGLGVFFSYAPRLFGGRFRVDSLGDNFVGGLAYRGLIPGRDRDAIGAGIAWSELFQGGTNQETATELFYRAYFGERAFLQPDLQYISSPSGIYRDALAVGLRFQVNF